MSKFKGMKNLCLRKMIILGYLYKCLPEILRFVSFATCNECKFENLFIELKKEKEKLKKLDFIDEIIINTDSEKAISIAKKLNVK